MDKGIVSKGVTTTAAEVRLCQSKNCHSMATVGKMFCNACIMTGAGMTPLHTGGPHTAGQVADALSREYGRRKNEQSMAERYPQYYKPVGKLNEVDIYAVCMLFEVEDGSGALHHAIKKLLLSGVRTGGKSKHDDVREARDTLNRYLELHPDLSKVNDMLAAASPAKKVE